MIDNLFQSSFALSLPLLNHLPLGVFAFVFMVQRICQIKGNLWEGKVVHEAAVSLALKRKL
jgi:hypothetical protein